jgi:muramoyltetrapeptide carboxypeptidase
MTLNTRPNALKPGDRIAIISPAGAINSPEQLTRTIKIIESKGYVPVVGRHAAKSNRHNGYNFAGTDEERQEDLRWAFANPDIKAVWASKGGYGSVRLRAAMLEIICKNQHNKWYIGYSDNTYLSSMLLTHGHTQSISGENIINGYSSPDSIYERIFNILSGHMEDHEIPSHKFNSTTTVEGIIAGGNASLIYSMLGTPDRYELDNLILYIEDVGEAHYAMDRILNAIKLSLGDKIKAVIIGGMRLNGSDYDETSYRIANDVFSGYPRMFGFPNGHIVNNQPIVMGARVKLEINASGNSTLKYIA